MSISLIRSMRDILRVDGEGAAFYAFINGMSEEFPPCGGWEGHGFQAFLEIPPICDYAFVEM